MLIQTQPVGLGYLQLDNRNAPVPGLPAMFEADTYTCTHCCRVVVMNPERKRERYKCRGCDHHICDPCAAHRAAGGGCKTFKQLADEIMTAAEKAATTGDSLIVLP
jgi:hypothetical protein